MPHSIIFERVRPQELRHTKVNDKLAQGFRDKFYQKTKEHTLKIIDGENHTFAEFPKQAENIRQMNDTDDKIMTETLQTLESHRNKESRTEKKKGKRS